MSSKIYQKGAIDAISVLVVGATVFSYSIGAGPFITRFFPKTRIGIPGLTPGTSAKITPTPTPTQPPAEPVNQAGTELPDRPPVRQDISPTPTPTPTPTPYACHTTINHGAKADPTGETPGTITCCTYCYTNADCASSEYCTLDADRCDKRCTPRPTPTPTRTQLPTPTPTPTYPPGFEPTPTPTPTFSPHCTSSGNWKSEEGLTWCCTDCPNDAYCGPGKYCKSDGCNTYCAVGERPTPTPTPTLRPTPTPTPTPDPNRTPRPTPTFAPHCTSSGNWKSEEGLTWCCTDCPNDAYCGPGSTCVTNGCNKSCVRNPSPTPTETSTAAPTPAPTQAPQQEPAALPGDILYIPVTLGRNLVLLFTFDTEKKVKLHQDFANQKLREVGYLLEKGKVNEAQKHMQSFESELAATNSLIQKLEQQRSPALQNVASQSLTQNLKHLQLLERLRTIAPEGARDALAATENVLEKNVSTGVSQVADEENLRRAFAEAFAQIDNPFAAARHIDLLNRIHDSLPQSAKPIATEVKQEALRSIETFHQVTRGKHSDAFASYLKEAGVDKQTQAEILQEVDQELAREDIPFDIFQYIDPETLKELQRSLEEMKKFIEENPNFFQIQPLQEEYQDYVPAEEALPTEEPFDYPQE